MDKQKQRSFTLENLQEKDIPEAVDFLVAQSAGDLTKEAWIAKFALLWEANPFFVREEHARGWVLKDENGAIAGFLGNIPVKYAWRTQERQGFWATTWFVREDARSRSLDLFRRFMAQDGVLFDTTPIPGVELILKRLKFSPLNASWLQKDFFLPLDLTACAHYVGWRFCGKPWLQSLSWPVVLAAKAVSALRSFFGRVVPSTEVDVREVRVVPSDKAEWWAEFKSRKNFTVARDEQAMSWFFFSGEFALTRKVLEVRKGGTLIGFVALKTGQRPGYSYVELVDIALLDMSEEVLCAVVAALKRAVRSWVQDAAYVKVNALSDVMRKILLRAGFWEVTGKSRFYFLDKRGDISPEDVYGTPLDGDRSLFP